MVKENLYLTGDNGNIKVKQKTAKLKEKVKWYIEKKATYLMEFGKNQNL